MKSFRVLARNKQAGECAGTAELTARKAPVKAETGRLLEMACARLLQRGAKKLIHAVRRAVPGQRRAPRAPGFGRGRAGQGQQADGNALFEGYVDELEGQLRAHR